ncbi:hypothetical protein [Corynebacterium glucuronolyticum]|uniref:FlgN protein n=2 Tax=Corynebacterium glucuronolyticum TaxID=39791 RepID=A0AAX1LA90_9CORY|nr:hypothetical protein [Corynebacterium glucuronolyticum]EEI63459.1 hypothetical protein HMPREF0293_1100 [Corynebacterium glucuronolyticum ATCC 51866]QRP71135.1 hypothetical protein I6J21_02970 [Corynebacterium glucuronolyticum]
MHIDTEKSLRTLQQLRDQLETFAADLRGSEPIVTSDMLGEGFADQARIIARQLNSIHQENLRRSLTLINATRKAEAQIHELVRQEAVNVHTLGAIDAEGAAR